MIDRIDQKSDIVYEISYRRRDICELQSHCTGAKNESSVC